MYTQCPECQTIFEIDEEALQTSLGIVHCGRCFKRFDALRTLTDSLPEQSEEPLDEHDPAEHAPILTEAVDAARSQAGQRKRRRHESITVTRPPLAPEPVSRNPEPPSPVPSRPVLDVAGAVPDDLFAEPARTATRGPTVVQDWRTIDLGGVVEAHAAPPPAADAGPAPADAVATAIVPADGVDQGGVDLAPGDGVDAAATDRHDGTHVYVPPRQRIARAHFAWGAILLLLALTLSAQLAWAARVQLLRDPATHALVARACQSIDCRIPPIADPAQLELLSRDVRPDPATAGALTITATLRNNASFRQAWPIVTVTLTDLDNHPVAMRRFRSYEYMTDPARRAAGIAPGATVAVAFEVADPGKNAVAFQFSFE